MPDLLKGLSWEALCSKIEPPVAVPPSVESTRQDLSRLVLVCRKSQPWVILLHRLLWRSLPSAPGRFTTKKEETCLET